MRIGIDLRSIQEKNMAGVGHYSYNLTQNIIHQDRHNEYYLFFNSWEDIPRKSEFSSANVIHSRLPSKIFNLSSLLLKHPVWGKQLDLFWQPNFNFINLDSQVKSIVTVHDISWRINPAWYSPKMRLWHALQKVDKVFQRAHKVVAVSNSTAADIQYFYNLPDDKIEVISSAVDSHHQAQSKCSLPDKYLFFLGTVEPRKNVDSILEAMQRIYERYPEYQDIHIVIAGGRGWSNRRVWRKLNNSPYRQLMHYIGYITPEQKKTLIRRSLGLVWPSFYEGFGFPPVETLLQNKPVITSLGSSLPQVVQDKAILINPYNVNEIMHAILQLIQGVYPDLSETQTDEWQQRFSWQQSAKKYLQLFNSLNTK